MPAHTTGQNYETDSAQDDLIAEQAEPELAEISSEPTKNSAERELDGMFSLALMAVDKEFGQLLHEIEELSKSLRTRKPTPQALRVAGHPAVWQALKRALVGRELRALALTDDLTSLYNRRGFFPAAAQQLKLARRGGKPGLMWFCDLDGLKQINDTFGHREGDVALVRTANALEATFRDSDVLARIGGDEFVALATDINPEGHQQLLARLRNCLKQANRRETRYKLSLSVGAAWFDPRNAISLGALMEKADQAMYERKRARLKAQQTRSLAQSNHSGAARPSEDADRASEPNLAN